MVEVVPVRMCVCVVGQMWHRKSCPKISSLTGVFLQALIPYFHLIMEGWYSLRQLAQPERDQCLQELLQQV